MEGALLERVIKREKLGFMESESVSLVCRNFCSSSVGDPKNQQLFRTPAGWLQELFYRVIRLSRDGWVSYFALAKNWTPLAMCYSIPFGKCACKEGLMKVRGTLFLDMKEPYWIENHSDVNNLGTAIRIYLCKICIYIYIYIYYDYCSVHRWSILIIVQRDAIQSSMFIILQVHSTCFGRQPHPSSGVHRTVTTASGNCHIFSAANSLQRVQAWPTWREVATVSEAVVTVMCTPDDGCGWHPKHIECRRLKPGL